jgi:hypothetical protein
MYELRLGPFFIAGSPWVDILSSLGWLPLGRLSSSGPYVCTQPHMGVPPPPRAENNDGIAPTVQLMSQKSSTAYKVDPSRHCAYLSMLVSCMLPCTGTKQARASHARLRSASIHHEEPSLTYGFYRQSRILIITLPAIPGSCS